LAVRKKKVLKLRREYPITNTEYPRRRRTLKNKAESDSCGSCYSDAKKEIMLL
jgi:hypothetical protein